MAQKIPDSEPPSLVRVVIPKDINVAREKLATLVDQTVVIRFDMPQNNPYNSHPGKQTIAAVAREFSSRDAEIYIGAMPSSDRAPHYFAYFSRNSPTGLCLGMRRVSESGKLVTGKTKCPVIMYQ